MSDAYVKERVEQAVNARIKSGQSVVRDWLIHEIVGQLEKPGGADEAFYLTAGFDRVGRIVSSVLGRYEPKAHAQSRDDQLTLDGFEYLQIGYSVIRNGRRMIVPTDDLTDDELIAKAAELDAMATGCLRHAEEIRDLVRMRRKQARNSA